VHAVPALVKLVDDPSRTVQLAAAGALRDLAPALRDQDAKLARETALALRRVIERAGAAPLLSDLRAASAEALVPLRQPDFAQLFEKLLANRAETPRVRIAALRAVGELGERNAGDVVLAQLDD